MKLGLFNPQLKLFAHLDKLKRWEEGNSVYPVMIEWFLTNYCNHKCNFCSFANSHTEGVMDTDVVLKTLSEIASLGVRAINWTGGGEPLLHSHYSLITKHAKFCGLEQGLFTNGSLLTPELIDNISKTHTWVRISVDAGTPETYKKIKGVGDFNKVMKNIILMVDGQRDCEVGAGFVITKDNYKEIEIFAEDMNYCGVDYIQFKPQIHPYYDNKQEETDFWKKEVTPRLEKASKNPRVMVNLYKLQDLEDGLPRQYDTCYGWEFCPCIADGKLYRCNYLAYMTRYCLGDLREYSFAEIWKHQEPMIPCDKCQLLCKNDAINKVLYAIKHKTFKHGSFL